MLLHLFSWCHVINSGLCHVINSEFLNLEISILYPVYQWCQGSWLSNWPSPIWWYPIYPAHLSDIPHCYPICLCVAQTLAFTNGCISIQDSWICPRYAINVWLLTGDPCVSPVASWGPLGLGGPIVGHHTWFIWDPSHKKILASFLQGSLPGFTSTLPIYLGLRPPYKFINVFRKMEIVKSSHNCGIL